ncbi:phosphopantothenoylcysteine decarboxylase/phosphopantothenate--cysteine ligase [Chthonomonas calidirosea]|uniref:Coenzyme A biosynthesis bifunctional protein CoaBC n=1 Tax=Chthonomonas calidirosea (strain DSM 23976 / ICMP 18418 / T49) TaxID=1303518 RepID=S0EVZ5_CHTCT|nr:bifunctional phosphopantothenoylcysteine decarboxylase/phosphopantothenate--cysteine ligase CoaBC [Chthonomonas calidirosea]CCW35607.1 Phosphopantothenate-cysteine ligase/Phosphopantothenoylcysteine decarboxylase [Chthonomonas calidirosea T49]CEK19768.1 phosphopantothenoylcysteine decarboxylase/phosphopantothenate--cysteine ligase [Chthonomonas calidirosea]
MSTEETWLAGKSILLGVTGSIAAYKAADICSRLGKLGADVHVVLTAAAAQFVGPATFRALTRNPVLTDVFEEPHARRIAHIELAQSADLVLVAPATADILAHMAHGFADDMLTTCLLAVPTSTPLLVAPAMNTVMWQHPATQANLRLLQERGVHMIEPEYGLLACQDVGVGKLAEPDTIVRRVVDTLLPLRDYTGVHVLVTAGPTREPLDPVRFLSNRSSGKMGYAIAERAQRRGAKVTLISGPTSLAVPPGVNVVWVETSHEMLAACQSHFQMCDLFIAAAAVSDYTPAQRAPHKLKKSERDGDIVLTLRPTPDILATLARQKGPHQVVVGFAAETENLLEHARHKLEAKQLDLIVANDVTQEGAGFEKDTNVVTLLWPDGRQEPLPLLPKSAVADRLLTAVRPLLKARPLEPDAGT